VLVSDDWVLVSELEDVLAFGSVLLLVLDAVRSEDDVSSIVSFCAHAARARPTAAAMLSK
jgi:hypothetical protein